MKKITIVTGPYGVGKTEFILNYALYVRKQTVENIKIGDMDTINPYFRPREREDFLKHYNIEVLGNSLNNNIGQDIPAISGNILNPITKGEYLILDLAGSLNGLKILPLISENIPLSDYDFLMVINIFREECNSKDKILNYINNAQKCTSLKITGLVNNSHMLHETSKEHVLLGQEMVLDVSNSTNIPFKYTLIRNDIYLDIKDEIKSKVICFDKLIMRENWQ